MATIHIYIEKDERYPDYGIYSDGGSAVQVSNAQLCRWQKAIAAYNKAQREMGKAWKKANGHPAE